MEFKLKRKIQPEIKLGNKKYPEKLLETAEEILIKTGKMLGEMIVSLHEKEVIELNRVFDDFYLCKIYLYDKKTFQFNFKPKFAEGYLLTVGFRVEGSPKGIDNRHVHIFVKTDKTFDEMQSVLSAESCFITTLRADSDFCKHGFDLSNLFKARIDVFKLLKDLEVFNQYL